MNTNSNHTLALNAAIHWLKAIGIAFVMMHHFSRSLWFSAGMDAPPINQWQLFDNLVPHNGRAPFQASFAWLFEWFARWGYVGVHMFIAASVIGHELSLKRPAVVWTKFMLGKLRKIWLPSCLSVLVFAVLSANTNWGLVLAKLFWLSYLDPKYFFSINSPLWFLVLLFQYYAILPLIRKLDLGSWRLWLASTVLSYLTRSLLDSPIIASVHPYLAHACILTWLPSLIIGMHLVRQHARSELARHFSPLLQHIQWVSLSLIFILGQFWLPVYPLADSALALAFVMLSVSFRRISAPRWITALSVTSFYLFLYHRPFVSSVLSRSFQKFGDLYGLWAWLNLIGLTATLALIVAIVYKRRWKQFR